MEPDHRGPYGRAYNVRAPMLVVQGDRPHSGVADWLIDAPGQTPFWRWYRLSCVHLRPVDGLDAAKITEPGATHEWLLFAIHPEQDVDPDDPMTYVQTLRPINFTGQYVVPGHDGDPDAVAAEITDRAAWAMTQGYLWAEPPLSGQTEPWHTLLQNTIVHYRDGTHTPGEHP